MSKYFDTVAPIKTVENAGTAHERTRYDHEAFGEISVTRRTSGPETTMFGSDVGHRSAVVIKLSRAHQLRSAGANNVYADEKLFEFEVSDASWARIVSSAGGGATPITLRMAPPVGTVAVGIPQIEAESMRQQFSNDIEAKFAEYMSAGKELLEKFEELADSKGAISKPVLRSLREKMEALVDGLPRNFAFMQDQLHRSMERAGDQVRTEVESYLAANAQAAGNKVLLENAPALRLPNAGDKEE